MADTTSPQKQVVCVFRPENYSKHSVSPPPGKVRIKQEPVEEAEAEPMSPEEGEEEAEHFHMETLGSVSYSHGESSSASTPTPDPVRIKKERRSFSPENSMNSENSGPSCKQWTVVDGQCMSEDERPVTIKQKPRSKASSKLAPSKLHRNIAAHEHQKLSLVDSILGTNLAAAKRPQSPADLMREEYNTILSMVELSQQKQQQQQQQQQKQQQEEEGQAEPDQESQPEPKAKPKNKSEYNGLYVKKVTCRKCGQRFDYEFLLEDHERFCVYKTHHGGKGVYRCEVTEKCTDHFRTKRELRQHLKTHSLASTVDKLRTQIGGIGDNRSESEEEHIEASTVTMHARAHDERRHKCIVCGYGFLSQGYLKNHMRVRHKKDLHGNNLLVATPEAVRNISQHATQGESRVYIENAETGEDAGSPGSTRVVRPPKSWPCEECGRVFPSLIMLRKHTDRHLFSGMALSERVEPEPEPTRTYKCQLCDVGIVFSSGAELSKHIRALHTNNALPRGGRKPNKILAPGRKHVKILATGKGAPVRPEAEPIDCSECHKSFAGVNALSQHMGTHYKGRAGFRVNVCYICGDCFTYKKSLRLHVQEKHNPTHGAGAVTETAAIQAQLNTRFQCNACGACFLNSFNLLCHVDGQICLKVHKCKECDKSFQNSAALSTHIKCRHGGMSYKCGECQQSFTDGKELREHRKSHEGATPYNCQRCGAWFRFLGSLKTHECVTGDTYACVRCRKGFPREYDLTMHKRICRG